MGLASRFAALRMALLLVLPIAAPVAVFAGGAFTPEHVARLQYVTSVHISPDGKHVAYTRSVPRVPFDDDNGGAFSELHVVDADGNSRPFITGEVSISDVAWTPDGEGISFVAKRGDDKHGSLYVIPVDGGEARRVLSHETGISSYSWHSDGSQIAFIATDKEDKDVKKLEDKGFNAEIYEEDYRNRRVWIGRADADAERNADEREKPRALELPGAPSELHFSPVDDRLVVALAPSPLIDDHYMKRKVHVVDSASGEIVARIENPGKLGPVAWSPGGKHLAMVSGEDINDPGEGRLMVVPAAGGELKDILPDFQGHVTSIEWQDNDTIMYLGDQGVHTELAEIKLDGSGKKAHVAGGKMVLASLDLSKNGQVAALRSESPTHPSEAFIMKHGDSAPKRLTDSNPWLADMEFAKQEVIEYDARDGTKIQGLLIRPLNEQAGQAYPLILAVHGGPEAHEQDGWLTWYSRPGQVGAAQGFAVFYPNYRGSTGRGVEFSKAGQADYGGKEFDDLVDAVDHLVGTGLVDKDRVGITGGSYGGFATAWCSTYHTERFAAGVMFVGISDHISKSGTTDIPEEMFLVHSRTRLWDGWQFFLERSPIYYVEQARTPLLIMHGKEDTRVHPSQSMELYRHLKTLGKTAVRLVFYPGEGHGNRKAAGRYDYQLRQMRWFNHYLKGDGARRDKEAPAYELEYPLNKKKDDEKKDEASDDEDETDDE